jgi:hypothetical protein
VSGVAGGLRARTIEIAVRYYGVPVEATAADARALETYGDELLAALSVPGSCAVGVEGDDRRHDGLRPERMRIDGERCVQPVAGGAPAAEPAGRLRALLCANRELLVSPRFARDCRRTWAPGGELDFADAPSAFLHELLVLLVRRGFSIARARAWLRWHDPAEPSTPAAAFEEAAAFGDPLPVRLSLPAGEAAGVAEEVRDRLAWDWGLETDVAATEEPPSEFAFRARVNDLPLPPGDRDAGEPLAAAIVRALLPHLGALVTTATTGAALSRVAGRLPLLEQAIAQRYERAEVAAVLRALADERIPVGDARGILETLAAVNLDLPAAKEAESIVLAPETATVRRIPEGVEAPGAGELAETVRAGLARQIAALHGPGGRLAAILLDPRLEERIAAHALDRHQVRRVERELRDVLPDGGGTVVLVTAACRAAVASLLGPAFPDVPVLAYQELTPDLNVDAVARVSEPEPSFVEGWTRERLEERDLEVYADLAPSLPAEGDPDDAGLAGLIAIGAQVGRISARSRMLDESDLEEEREYLTIELEIVDDESAELGAVDESREDLTDMLSDLFSSQQGDD